MTITAQETTQKLLKFARDAGAQHADTIYVDGQSVSIDVREGALEHAERSEGSDIGLRVIIDQKQACVSASDISDYTLEQMAERAVAMAREAPVDEHIGLADPDMLVQQWDAAALELADDTDKPTPEQLQELGLQAEAAALGVKGVSKAQGSSAGWSDTSVYLAASNGFEGGYRRTSHSTTCVAIAGDGSNMERDYCGEGRTYLQDMPDAETIGHLAGMRAVAKHGAIKPPTGNFPVLFDERISSTLIGHILSAINGVAILRGSSWLKNDMGAQILPANMSLVEDPYRKRVPGSKPFDAEGLAVQKQSFFENGVLKSWVLDLAAARKLGLQSTANAARGVGGPPSPSVGNLALIGGQETRQQLLSDMGTGLLVTGLIGSTISPTTGDYSRGAHGFWVENGEIKHPVNECTIAGNLKDMLKTIRAADDAPAHLSRLIPSLLVGRLTIAGA